MRLAFATTALCLLPLAAAAEYTETEAAADYTKAQIAESKRICELAEKHAPKYALSFNRALVPNDRDYKKLMSLMPAPPPAWKVKTETVDAFFTDTIGCGIDARRIYDTGKGDVLLSIEVLPAFSHPRIVQELEKQAPKEKIAGRRILMGSTERIMLQVGWIVISASGSASDADRRTLIERIDFDAVDRAGKVQ